MRIACSAFLLSLACASVAQAQESQQTFRATGASQEDACEAATKQARDWVKRGKSEGRARELLDDGQCTCTGDAGALTCTLAVRASDVQHEEEEDR